MRKQTVLFSLFLVVLLLFSLTACDPLESASKPASKTAQKTKTVQSAPSAPSSGFRSNDRVMPTFVDISLFDEENYSSVFLGKKFKLNAVYAGETFTVPMKVSGLSENGWRLTGGADPESTVMAYRSMDVKLSRQDGKTVTATLVNPGDRSVKLKECSLVRFRFENDFYKNPKNYTAFQINGINNRMAITDIIDTLGTPSHFTGISPDNYRLVYSVSKENRRTGITVCINPQEDNITAVEITAYP